MMDSDSMVIFKFGGTCVLRLLSKFNSFESVVEYALERFPALDKNHLKFNYAFQDLNNILLDDEEDFSTMVAMVNRSVGDVINVTIQDNSVISPIPLTSPVTFGVSDMLSDSNTNQNEIVVSNQTDPLVVNSLQIPEEHLMSNLWSQGIVCVGQCFKGGAKDFRDALSKYAIEVGFSYDYAHNNLKRVSATCKHKKDKSCPWRIYAAVNDCNGYMYIKTFVNDHTCGSVHKSHANKRLSSDIVSRLIGDEIRLKPSTTPKEVVKKIKESYDFDISYRVAWSSLGKAKNQVHGDASVSYGLIQPLFDAIKSKDPETHHLLEFDQVNRTFERCFIAFGACLHGFNSCNPMLFLHAISLSGKYKGFLLSAVTKDGNQGLLPVGFAIVKSEDIENWTWFLNSLKPHLLPREITFISNQHQSIIDSVKSVFPNDHHGVSLADIFNNLRDKLRGRSVKDIRERLIYLLSKCANAPTESIYEKCFDDLINEGGEQVINFMETLPKEYYANAYFKGRCYNELTLNAAKTFNSQIEGYSGLPVADLIDAIRVKLMDQIYKRSVEGSNWTTTLCPEYHKRYLDNLKEGITWTFSSVTVNVYEVQSVPIVVVDLEKYTCSCNKWQEIGFPCSHAMCVISKSKMEPFKYVEDYFYTSKYIECYSKFIPALSGYDRSSRIEEEIAVHPPEFTRQPGRPRKRMIQSEDKVKKKIRCGKCGQFGNHNSLTCDVPK